MRFGIEGVVEELLGEAACQLEADHALTEAQDLCIVGQHEALNGEGVMRRTGADALDLVGCHGDAQPGTADEDAAIGLAFGDHPSGIHRDVRVINVLTLVDSSVDDLIDAGIVLEFGLDRVLVTNAGAITGDYNAKSHIQTFRELSV